MFSFYSGYNYCIVLIQNRGMNPLKILAIFLLVLLFSALLPAQTEEKNHAKFSFYKERFYSQFIVAGPQNMAGMNIPASIRYFHDSLMKWCDATVELAYYMIFLSTEYKIAKTNHEQTSETIQKLWWALDAFERLDMNAESCFRENKNIYPHDLNGFFIRDDVTPQILRYQNGKLTTDSLKRKIAAIYSDYTSPNLYDKEMSKDQVWSLLLGFASIIHFIDDSCHVPGLKNQLESIPDRAEKNVARLIKYLQGKQDWIIYNPVNDKPVKRGAQVVESILHGFNRVYFDYGFAAAGNRLCTKNSHQNIDLHCHKSKKHQKIFEVQSGLALYFKRDDYSFRTLMTIIGKTGDYDILVNRQKKTGRYEHFRLLYSLFHPEQVSGDKLIASKNYYFQLLCKAPEKGTFNFGQSVYGSMEWSSTSRLVWPESQGNRIGQNKGAYNGLDYLVLYNLYRLCFQNP